MQRRSTWTTTGRHPVPLSSVCALPCRPWLTLPPSQFDINDKAILRPYRTHKDNELPMGVYFLENSKYSRTFWKAKGERVTEEIRLFDEVRCSRRYSEYSIA